MPHAGAYAMITRHVCARFSAHSERGGTTEYQLGRCKHCMELFKKENCMDPDVVACTEYDVLWFKSFAYVVGLSTVPLLMSSRQLLHDSCGPPLGASPSNNSTLWFCLPPDDHRMLYHGVPHPGGEIIRPPPRICGWLGRQRLAGCHSWGRC